MGWFEDKLPPYFLCFKQSFSSWSLPSTLGTTFSHTHKCNVVGCIKLIKIPCLLYLQISPHYIYIYLYIYYTSQKMNQNDKFTNIQLKWWVYPGLNSRRSGKSHRKSGKHRVLPWPRAGLHQLARWGRQPRNGAADQVGDVYCKVAPVIFGVLQTIWI